MSTIAIEYDGTDITSDVIFESASFESQLGAVPGAFEFTVRDNNQVHSFTTGKEVTMSIDGTRYFGGFVTQVVSKLAFPVDDTSAPGSVRTREFLLRGVDYNILFDKRVIYNIATPTDPPALYSPTLTDLQVLQTFFSDYINLTGDSIDVTTYVEAVGDPTPTSSQGAYMNPGDPWRKQMESLAAFTGAIWYIDANKALHYQDIESISPAWEFSDTPNRVTTFGFRDLEYVEDATNLINDALVWGGSEFGSTGVTKQTVFGRSQNTTSIGIHGRWQLAERHFNEWGYFEASGCTVRSQVIVFGVPGADASGDNTRGLQYPQRNVRLTWFNTTIPTPLTAGSVVNVTLNVFGAPPIELALPVRSITITFPTTTSAQFQGFLGIQTTDPWSLWKYLRAQQQRTTATASQSIVTSDGSSPATVPNTYVSTTPTPDPDGSNTVFVTPDPYAAGTLEVFIFHTGETGGLLQRSIVDYNESDPETGEFTFITPPLNTDTLWVRYYSA